MLSSFLKPLGPVSPHQNRIEHSDTEKQQLASLNIRPIRKKFMLSVDFLSRSDKYELIIYSTFDHMFTHRDQMLMKMGFQSDWNRHRCIYCHRGGI